jgi:hypothetical protein
MWFRVFGASDVEPDPAALLEHLHGQGTAVSGQFHGDTLGWFRVELTSPDGPNSLTLDRFQVKEDDIRDELNTWAAWIETAEENPHHRRLMQQVISTVQLFVLESPGDGAYPAWCIILCRFLARLTAGVYQVDREGFFDADGTLLVSEH